MLDVHEQHRASGGMLRSGFFKLVERRQGHFMLSRASIAPVARKCRGRLHDRLADKIGCKSGCDARACRKSKKTGRAPCRERGFSKCRSRWSPYHATKNKAKNQSKQTKNR